ELQLGGALGACLDCCVGHLIGGGHGQSEGPCRKTSASNWRRKSSQPTSRTIASRFTNSRISSSRYVKRLDPPDWLLRLRARPPWSLGPRSGNPSRLRR